MSIKLSDIETKKIRNHFGYEYRSRILIQTNRMVTKVEMDAWPVGTRVQYEDIIRSELAKAILHHIYGDLVPHVNELAILAQHHITGVNDQGEITGLREGLRKLLQGE